MFAAAARAARPLACAGLLPAAYLTDATKTRAVWSGASRTRTTSRARAAFGWAATASFPGVNKSSGEIMAIKQVSKKHLPPEP